MRVEFERCNMKSLVGRKMANDLVDFSMKINSFPKSIRRKKGVQGGAAAFWSTVQTIRVKMVKKISHGF